MWRTEGMPVLVQRIQAVFRRRHAVIVRLGASTCQVWLRQDRVLSLVDEQRCAHLQWGASEGWSEALARVRAQIAQQGAASVTVVIDSNWMPLMLIETGPRPLSATALTDLARYRIADVYGQAAQGWQVRADHVSGQRQALVFALPTQLQEVLRATFSQHESSAIELTGIQPTFSWLWNQGGDALRRARTPWLVCAEQDRCILAHVQGGRITGLHPSLPTANDLGSASSALALHALRCGIAGSAESAVGLSMDALPGIAAGAQADAAIDWHVLTEVVSLP